MSEMIDTESPKNIYANTTEIESSFESAERVKMFSRRTGLDALGMTQEFDDRCKKVDEEVRAKFYRGDEEGYKQYLARMATGRARTHDNLLRIEKAEYLRGDMMRRESMFAADVESMTQGIITDSAATKAERGIVLDEARRQYESTVAELGGDTEKLNAIMEADRSGTLEDEETIAVAEKYGKAYGRLAAAIDASKDFGKAHAEANVVPKLRQWAREKHKEWYDYYMKRGWDSDSAYAGATQKTSAGAGNILSNIGTSGDDELLRYVLEELGSPDARRVRMLNDKGVPLVRVEVRKGEDGKDVKVEVPIYDDSKFDPSGSMFMPPDRIKELTDELNRRAAATERIQQKQAQAEQQAIEDEGFRTANVIEAQFQDELGRGDPDPVKVEEWREQLFQLTKNGSKNVSNHARELRDKIDSMIRADERYKARTLAQAKRLMTEEDFRKEYAEYAKNRNSQALFEAVVMNKEGILERAHKHVPMDGKKRMMLLLTYGFNNGIIKHNEEWDGKWKELEKDHIANNMAEAREAIAGLDNLTVDKKTNKKMRSAGSASDKKADRSPLVDTMYIDPKDNKVKIVGGSIFKYKIGDTEYPVSVDQMNIVMQKVAEFQMRHANPSMEDARLFAQQVLEGSLEDYEIKHWFMPNEKLKRIGNITTAADEIINRHFNDEPLVDYNAAKAFFETEAPLSTADLRMSIEKAREKAAAEKAKKANKEGGAK